MNSIAPSQNRKSIEIESSRFGLVALARQGISLKRTSRHFTYVGTASQLVECGVIAQHQIPCKENGFVSRGRFQQGKLISGPRRFPDLHGSCLTVEKYCKDLLRVSFHPANEDAPKQDIYDEGFSCPDVEFAEKLTAETILRCAGVAVPRKVRG